MPAKMYVHAPLCAEQRLHKRHFIEHLEVVDLLADANVLHWNFEFIGDSDDDTTFGRAVELRDCQGRER